MSRSAICGQVSPSSCAHRKALARVLQERGYWRSTGDLRLLRRYERERKAALAPSELPSR